MINDLIVEETGRILERCNTFQYHAIVAEVVVTFKFEEEIYSKVRDIAKEERGISEILREAVPDRLQKK